MKVRCAKNCGVDIEVTAETLLEAQKTGRSFDIAHEVCPRDQKHQAKYVLSQALTRFEPDGKGGHEMVGTILTSVSADVIGATYEQVKDELQGNLAYKWNRLEPLIPASEADINVTVVTDDGGGKEEDASNEG